MRTALRLCPQAVCVRPRMQRYQQVSRLVFGVFHEVTPLVQGLSLDEAFLDVTASQQLLGGAVDIARRIKRRIRELTGLTASVGVAPNKLVAKIASELMKPDGLTVVTAERVRAVLDPLSVRRLPGLGRKTGARVEAAGIGTFGELRSAPDALLWPLFGRYSAWLAGNPGAKLRLLGVVLTDLNCASQLGLFEQAGRPGRLDAALDEACARFGSRALRRGSAIE